MPAPGLYQVNAGFDKLIARSADPVSAANRFEHMMEDAGVREAVGALDEPGILDLLDIIGISRFLYHFLRRHPDSIARLRRPFARSSLDPAGVNSFDELRTFKYRQLLNITWMDICGDGDYREILDALSLLAEFVVRQTFRLALSPGDQRMLEDHLCTFALGKLGAGELNFSSDIDLIFVCSNPVDVPLDVHDYQKVLQDGIRSVSSHLEQRTAEGFLYRVDLKLRPWGNSGPLVASIDETENYYEASSEAWERFAWLRARAITGPGTLAGDLKKRLHPFVYKRSLSSDDLDRFFEIKNEMYKARRKKGYWNVKVGEGGIRDLEFFIQMLQLVNASSYPELQVTGTLNILAGLEKAGLVTGEESLEISHSYLFLRKLENRLQMFDEQQTHELPEDHQKRLVIARSLRIPGSSDNEVLDNFENYLFTSRSIARNYFERILPGKET